MRALITFIAILTVGIVTAQSEIVVSHGISHGDNTYTHIKGNNNNAETCFTATGSSTIVGNVNGLVIETIVIDNTPYAWTGVGAEVVADAFSRWDDLNEIYRNRGSQRPILDRTTDLLNCDGWSRDTDGWYINSDFAGYAYYLNEVNGRFEARLTTGYGTATNSQYYQYLPGFGTGVDGDGNTDPNGLGIYFNNGNGFETIDALEEEIVLAIGRHMNPQTEEEEEEVEDGDEVLKVTKIVKEEATVDPLNAAIAEMLQPHDTYFANQQRKYKLEYSALSGPNSQLKKHSDLAWFFQKIMKEQSSNRDKLGFEQDMHRVIFAAKNSTSHKGSGKEREIRTVIVEAAAKMLKIYNS